MIATDTVIQELVQRMTENLSLAESVLEMIDQLTPYGQNNVARSLIHSMGETHGIAYAGIVLAGDSWPMQGYQTRAKAIEDRAYTYIK